MSLAKPVGGDAAAVPARPLKLISRRRVLAAPLGLALAGTVAASLALDPPARSEVPFRGEIDEYTW